MSRPDTTLPAAVPVGAPTGTDAPAGTGSPPAIPTAPGAAPATADRTAAVVGGPGGPAPGPTGPVGRPAGRPGSVSLTGLHPTARADLQVSAPLRRGPAVVHLVRDPVAGRTYELGSKEHFVLSQLDGVRTLGEIGGTYGQRFGARLGDAHWGMLLGLLGRRHLLVGAPTPAAAAPEEPRNTVLTGHARLADAPALVDRLHRALRPLLRPPALVAAGVLVAAMLAVLAADLPDLLDRTGTALRQPGTIVAVLVVLQLSMAGHELAHGVVARAFGGTVTEFGLRWRLPMFYPYCAVQDVQFLPRRRQQVAVAAAGAGANLLFLLPFAVLWLVRPGPAVAALLVFGVATAMANLVPLPPLDGYKILGYALGTIRLAVESRGYLALLLHRADRSAYPAGLRRTYASYGIFVVLVAAAGVAAFVLVGYRVLAGRWGPGAGLAPTALLLVLLALWGFGLLARRRRTSEVVA